MAPPLAGGGPEAFATQPALAIHNARLFNQIEAAKRVRGLSKIDAGKMDL
jgi:hypothetical protein